MFNFSSQTIMDKIYWNWLLFYNISNFFQTIHPSAPPLPSTMLLTVCDCPQHCIGGGWGDVLRSNQHSSKYFVHDCRKCYFRANFAVCPVIFFHHYSSESDNKLNLVGLCTRLLLVTLTCFSV